MRSRVRNSLQGKGLCKEPAVATLHPAASPSPAPHPCRRCCLINTSFAFHRSRNTRIYLKIYCQMQKHVYPPPPLTRVRVFREIQPCSHCSMPEGCNSRHFFGSVRGCNVVTSFGSVSGLTESFGLISGHGEREHFVLHPQSRLMETIQLPVHKKADEAISAGWAQIIQHRWSAQEPPCEDRPQQSSRRAFPCQHPLLFQPQPSSPSTKKTYHSPKQIS